MDLTQPDQTPDDWRVEFEARGEKIARWVSGTATREDALRTVMHTVGIFDRSLVSRVIIRRRKEVERWQTQPRRAW